MTFAELEAAQHASAQALTRSDALARLEQHLAAGMLAEPRGAMPRNALLETARAQPYDTAARDRCRQLLSELVRAVELPVRPGIVEDLWYLDGLLDRLLRP